MAQCRRAVKGRSGAGRANGAPAGPRGRVVRSRPAWDGPCVGGGEKGWAASGGPRPGRGGRKRVGQFLGWAENEKRNIFFKYKSFFYFEFPIPSQFQNKFKYVFNILFISNINEKFW